MNTIALSCLRCYTNYLHILNHDETEESLSLCGTGTCQKCVNKCPICERSINHNNDPKLCDGCYEKYLSEIVEVYNSIDNLQIDTSIDVIDNDVIDVIDNYDVVVTDDAIIVNASTSVNGNTTHGLKDLEVIDVPDDDYNDAEAMTFSNSAGIDNICKTICGIYCKINAGVGSDGDGGSTNGELRDSACKSIVKKLLLNETDTFLDIGSDSGLRVSRICALSNCACLLYTSDAADE